MVWQPDKRAFRTACGSRAKAVVRQHVRPSSVGNKAGRGRVSAQKFPSSCSPSEIPVGAGGGRSVTVHELCSGGNGIRGNFGVKWRRQGTPQPFILYLLCTAALTPVNKTFEAGLWSLLPFRCRKGAGLSEARAEGGSSHGPVLIYSFSSVLCCRCQTEDAH